MKPTANSRVLGRFVGHQISYDVIGGRLSKGAPGRFKPEVASLGEMRLVACHTVYRHADLEASKRLRRQHRLSRDGVRSCGANCQNSGHRALGSRVPGLLQFRVHRATTLQARLLAGRRAAADPSRADGALRRCRNGLSRSAPNYEHVRPPKRSLILLQAEQLRRTTPGRRPLPAPLPSAKIRSKSGRGAAMQQLTVDSCSLARFLKGSRIAGFE
jgi:hypothetical protein